MDFPEESFALGCLFSADGKLFSQDSYDDTFSAWNATNDLRYDEDDELQGNH